MTLRRFAFCLLVSIWPALSGASDLIEVLPTRLDLTPGRSGVLMLRNNGIDRVRFEVFAYAWNQAVDGTSELTETRDVSFFPSLLEILPGESRPIRIGVSRAPRDRELTYRLIVRQLPAASNTDPGTAVRVLTELSIPIFVAPKGAGAKPRLEINSLEDATLEFEFSNPGNASFRLGRIVVSPYDADGNELRAHALAGWYVLANGRRRYELEIPSGVCARLHEVVIEAEVAHDAPLRARRQLACTPR